MEKEKEQQRGREREIEREKRGERKREREIEKIEILWKKNYFNEEDLRASVSLKIHNNCTNNNHYTSHKIEK